MAIFRTYDKDGTELSASGGVNVGVQGGIDWLGGEHFLMATDRAIQVLVYDGKSGGVVKTLVSYANVNVLPKSIAVARNHFPGGEESEWISSDGLQVAVTFRINTGAPGWAFRIIWHDLETGLFSWIHDFGVQNFHGGITHNGNQWFITAQTLANQDVFLRADINGSSLKVLRQHNVALFVRDVCFDGMYAWGLEDAGGGSFNVAQYEIGVIALPRTVNTWTPAGAGHEGIATDGHHIIVSSDS